MSTLTDIYDDMKLYSSAERFFIEPTVAPRDVLVIDRITSEISVQDRSTVDNPLPLNVYRPVCGILGIIKLLGGDHLVVATHRLVVGKINGRDIYQLAGADVIPFARSDTHLTQQQIEDNRAYVRMVKSVLDTPGLYFSYDYDLTHTLQRLQGVSSEFYQIPMVVRADQRFVWNGHLLKRLKDKEFTRFALPLVQGFVSINKTVLSGKIFTWAIISRRSIQRAGTRLFMRGIDSQGQVANFVETEQIVETNTPGQFLPQERASFVQTRGSVPLHWSQIPDLRYKPPPKLQPGEDHAAACARHLGDQVALYGKQVLVNLVDQRGAEGALEQGYRAATAAAALPGVRYEAFDFHAECSRMRWHRLEVLIDRLAHELEEFSYFLVIRNTVVSRQSGVFRSNCVDCLDRTNVVQSMLARRSLHDALKKLNIIGPNSKIEHHPAFESLFKSVWADNADYISIQYSGTGALKTDFTRTGKRTRLGLLKDGYNSLSRYYKNNFADGFRQDAIDLFLGNYNVMDGEGVVVPCPLHKNKNWKYITFPSVLLVAVSMFCASAVLPSEYSTEVLMYLMFWGAMIGSTLSIIFRYGKEFVDFPRLREILSQRGSSNDVAL